jgi:hypothetical protein
MIGNKQLEKIICVACTKPFGEHKKRGLIRCIFRLQGTLVSDGIENKPPVSPIEDQE